MPPSISSSASAWARFRGKPSRTKPSAASGSESRSRISAIVTSSGTSVPESSSGCTCLPSSVPAAIAARNMSPVAMCGTPYSAEMRFACVPLPAPCGPSTKRFNRGSP
jgi:hypothetical protein